MPFKTAMKLWLLRGTGMFFGRRVLKRWLKLGDTQEAVKSIRLHAKQNVSLSRTHWMFTFDWSYMAFAELTVNLQRVAVSSDKGMCISTVCSPCEIRMTPMSNGNAILQVSVPVGQLSRIGKKILVEPVASVTSNYFYL